MFTAVLLAAACGVGSRGEPPTGGSPVDAGSADDAGNSVDATDPCGPGAICFLPIDGSHPDAPQDARGVFTAPDCAGCTFPPLTAPACPSSAPAIKIAYPNNGVLVPPNMNALSIQWTPFGGGYTAFEVDFANVLTDLRVITRCRTQTSDTSEPSLPSGGCALDVPQAAWTLLATANRGVAPVVVTVRGTTDGACATRSMDSVKMSVAAQDLVGTVYYWKSTATSNGAGGQIWTKAFGDTTVEQQVTGLAGSAVTASCNGCHVLSRDGQRMIVYYGDDDSDDMYAGLAGSLVDLTTNTVIKTTDGGVGASPPGFSAFSPTHLAYLTSDGPGAAPTGAFALSNGNTGASMSPVPAGSPTDRPTMPDWSADGRTVVYALPGSVAGWNAGRRGQRQRR